MPSKGGAVKGKGDAVCKEVRRQPLALGSLTPRVASRLLRVLYTCFSLIQSRAVHLWQLGCQLTTDSDSDRSQKGGNGSGSSRTSVQALLEARFSPCGASVSH